MEQFIQQVAAGLANGAIYALLALALVMIFVSTDHINFARLGIPVMFLFSDVHEDYHRPTDTAEKIDYDKIRRVSRLVLRILDALQTDKLDIGVR